MDIVIRVSNKGDIVQVVLVFGLFVAALSLPVIWPGLFSLVAITKPHTYTVNTAVDPPPRTMFAVVWATIGWISGMSTHGVQRVPLVLTSVALITAIFGVFAFSFSAIGAFNLVAVCATIAGLSLSTFAFALHFGRHGSVASFIATTTTNDSSTSSGNQGNCVRRLSATLSAPARAGLSFSPV